MALMTVELKVAGEADVKGKEWGEMQDEKTQGTREARHKMVRLRGWK